MLNTTLKETGTMPTAPSSSLSPRQAGAYRRYLAVLLNLAARLLPTWRSRGARRRRLQEIERACRATPAGETIFVSVASYRDPQCAWTVFDLFEKAACPSRVFVGVCQHNTDADADVLARYHKLVARRGAGDFSAQIRVYRQDAEQAQGPVPARHLIEKELYRDERYYLIVDSHTLFTPRWDAESIRIWTQARALAPKPILTMYPAGFRPFHRRWPERGYENRPPGYLHFSRFDEDTGLVNIQGADMARIPERPVRSLFWSASYSFGLGSQMREVPFDPHCSYVFIGEEISMAARLWTHGYDFFHPTRMVVYQMWERFRPLFWEQLIGTSRLHAQRRESEQAGYRRLQTLLGLREGHIEAPYGLGTARALAAYEKFIGLDMRRRAVTSLAGLTGMPENSTPEEVLCKFGSLQRPFSERFYSPKRSWP
ncbi:MAG: hypothetical protein LGR52_06530 [Candidatus Thiosymbion ectosymbiont of Robbea hypermnestra]|nr:hypothetical protein [Candidatus Thiosymbion ectosymbiont of Robbea hypermnestra]